MATTTQTRTNATVTNNAKAAAKATKVTALDTVKKNFSVKTNDGKLTAKERKAAEKAAKLAKLNAMQRIVEHYEHDGRLLTEKHQHYQVEFVQRGNKALYELLQDIYAYALRIDQSGMKDEIVAQLRWRLSKSNMKTMKSTHWLTTVVKFIVPTDRQTAHNYTRVLKVAFDEKLDAGKVADYIATRGGVAEIYKTEANVAAKQAAVADAGERAELVREIYLNNAHAYGTTYSFDGDLYSHPYTVNGDPVDEVTAQHGDFMHFVAKFDEATQKYSFVHACVFGRDFENTMLKHMAAPFADLTTEQLRALYEENCVAEHEWHKQQIAKLHKLPKAA